jgi:hypothetical protein
VSPPVILAKRLHAAPADSRRAALGKLFGRNFSVAVGKTIARSARKRWVHHFGARLFDQCPGHVALSVELAAIGDLQPAYHDNK